MVILWTDVPLPASVAQPSVFLAGPTPRKIETPSWRPEALKIFKDKGFKGTIWVPEWQNWSVGKDFNYLKQVLWEKRGLTTSTVIMFWVPRDLDTMPAFTTNVEFGRYVGMRPCVYGRPDHSPKNDYLDWMYNDLTGRKPCRTLDETIATTISCLSEQTVG
jgi:hypothetical protein